MMDDSPGSPRRVRAAMAAWLRERENESKDTQPRQLWQTCYRYYCGDQTWTRSADKSANMIDNRIRALVLSVAAQWADSRLSVKVAAEQSIDLATAAILDQVLARIFRLESLSLLLIGSNLYSMLWGSGFIGAEWNPELAHGRGDVELSLYSPFNVFPDPISDNPRHWRYLIVSTADDVDNLQAKHKNLAKEIHPEPEASDYATVWKSESDYALPASRLKNAAVVRRAWIRDADRVQYPQGRYVVAAGGTVVYDGKNPDSVYEFPLVQFVNFRQPGELWPSGEVEHLRKKQDELNHRLQQVYLTENSMANPTFVGTGTVNREQIVDIGVGHYIPLPPGADLRILPGATLPGAVYGSLARIGQEMEYLIGAFDVSQGRLPGRSPQPVGTIERLQQAANTRVRLRENLQTESLKLLARRVIKLLRRFYTPERYAAVVDPELLEGYDWNQMLEGWDSDLSVEIQVIPARGRAKEEEFAKRLALFQMGIIDRKAVLDGTDLVDKDAILARMEQAQAALALQNMPGPGAPGLGAEAPPEEEMGEEALPSPMAEEPEEEYAYE